MARLKADVDTLIDRVACLEIELAEEKDRVLRFIADYHARLGPLLAQVAILEAEVGRSRGQIEEILIRADEAAAEAAAQVQAAPAHSPTDPGRQKRLKAQYRSLARRLHPDLADGEEDRQRRTKLMARLTKAWAEGDEDAIGVLEAELIDPDDESQDIGDRIAVLTRSRAALEGRINSLEGELQETRRSDWELLRERAEVVAGQGGDLLADLASELTTRVKTLKMELRLRDGTETGLAVNNLQDSTPGRVVDARPGSAGQACSLGLCEHPQHLHKTPICRDLGAVDSRAERPPQARVRAAVHAPLRMEPGDVGRRIGGYEIEDLLGRGGMGTVYKAHQISLGRRVALKVIRPELRLDDEIVARFRREASAGALTHPNVVSVYDVGEDGDDLYIAMAYLPGGSLADRLQTSGPLPPDQVERIGRDIESALAFAHAEGIIHRDVKPSNILFDAADNAVLADFGVAAVTGLTALTSTRAVVGTPSYMAPELTRGGAATPASDLYALGCTLYEAVSGRPPFTGQDALAVLVQHRTDAPPPLPQDCPTALRSDIVTRLAKDPQERTKVPTGAIEADSPAATPVAETAIDQKWASATLSSAPADQAPPQPPPLNGQPRPGRRWRSRSS